MAAEAEKKRRAEEAERKRAKREAKKKEVAERKQRAIEKRLAIEEEQKRIREAKEAKLKAKNDKINKLLRIEKNFLTKRYLVTNRTDPQNEPNRAAGSSLEPRSLKSRPIERSGPPKIVLVLPPSQRKFSNIPVIKVNRPPSISANVVDHSTIPNQEPNDGNGFYLNADGTLCADGFEALPASPEKPLPKTTYDHDFYSNTPKLPMTQNGKTDAQVFAKAITDAETRFAQQQRRGTQWNQRRMRVGILRKRITVSSLPVLEAQAPPTHEMASALPENGQILREDAWQTHQPSGTELNQPDLRLSCVTKLLAEKMERYTHATNEQIAPIVAIPSQSKQKTSLNTDPDPPASYSGSILVFQHYPLASLVAREKSFAKAAKMAAHPDCYLLFDAVGLLASGKH